MIFGGFTQADVLAPILSQAPFPTFCSYQCLGIQSTSSLHHSLLSLPPSHTFLYSSGSFFIKTICPDTTFLPFSETERKKEKVKYICNIVPEVEGRKRRKKRYVRKGREKMAFGRRPRGKICQNHIPHPLIHTHTSHKPTQ